MIEEIKFRGNSKGVGLIEAIIALAILGIVAVAFLGGLSTALHATFITDERSTAQSLATSQMEYVKNQEYNKVVNPNSEVTYGKIAEPDDYYIRGLLREGYTSTGIDYNYTSEDIIGVPWNPEASPPAPSTDDNGIQKVTVIIYHPYDAAHPDVNRVLTLEDYKVNR